MVDFTVCVFTWYQFHRTYCINSIYSDNPYGTHINISRTENTSCVRTCVGAFVRAWVVGACVRAVHNTLLMFHCINHRANILIKVVNLCL